DHRSAPLINAELGLVLAFGPFGRDGVPVPFGDVPVRGFADVPALDGVYLDAVPRLLQHLDDVPLGYALFGAAQQDGAGLLASSSATGCVEDDRLVGRE